MVEKPGFRRKKPRFLAIEKLGLSWKHEFVGEKNPVYPWKPIFSIEKLGFWMMNTGIWSKP